MKLHKNKLYVIAGERNMLAANVLNGLYANVGQTSRTVHDRIKDSDYQQKANSGCWKVILEDIHLGNFEDIHVHELLRKRNDVKWNPESSNTEEFHFITDNGDGNEAKRIVTECLECLNIESVENNDVLEASNDIAIEYLRLCHRLRHISKFSKEDIYWFRVRSFVLKKTVDNKPYMIINFINNAGTYSNIFCWNWYRTDFYPKIGSTLLAKAKRGKISLATTLHNIKIFDLPSLEQMTDALHKKHEEMEKNWQKIEEQRIHREKCRTNLAARKEQDLIDKYNKEQAEKAKLAEYWKERKRRRESQAKMLFKKKERNKKIFAMIMFSSPVVLFILTRLYFWWMYQ